MNTHNNLNLERVLSALAVLGVGVGGVVGYQTKEPPATAADLLNEVRIQDAETHKEFELQDKDHDHEIDKLKIRETNRERYEVRVQEELKTQQDSIMLLQTQSIEQQQQIRDTLEKIED